MAPFLEETDRAVRQEAWELAARRRLQDREALDDLFDQMMALRIEIAQEAGFRQLRRVSPSATASGSTTASRTRSGSTQAVERVVVPAGAGDPASSTAQTLGVESLRPWDLSVDPLGRPPLQPFDDVEQLAAGTETDLPRGRPRARRPVRVPARPAAARPGQPQGEGPRRLPDDVRGRAAAVHLHERRRARFATSAPCSTRAGHAFHTLAGRGEPLAAYRESPLEFCEVASMTHGAPRRADGSTRSTTRPTPTAPTASCSRGSS